MKAANDIRNIQYRAKNEKFIQHNIEDFANEMVEIISEYAETNILSNECVLEFSIEDSRYQKYYLDDFNLAITLLCEELCKRGFKYDEQCDCGSRIIYVRW